MNSMHPDHYNTGNIATYCWCWFS